LSIVVSLGVPNSRARYRTAVLRSGNNLQLQFLAESDLRSVIAVHRNALEHLEEIALELRVSFRNMVAVMRRLRWQGHGDFIHRPKQRELLRRRRCRKVLSKKLA